MDTKTFQVRFEEKSWKKKGKIFLLKKIWKKKKLKKNILEIFFSLFSQGMGELFGKFGYVPKHYLFWVTMSGDMTKITTLVRFLAKKKGVLFAKWFFY